MPHTEIMKFCQNHWFLLSTIHIELLCTQLSGQPGRHNHLDQDPGAVARPGGPDQSLTHHMCCLCTALVIQVHTVHSVHMCVLYCTYLIVDILDGQFSLEASQKRFHNWSCLDLNMQQKIFF